jgi:dethiobiotin synthetase
VHPPAPARIIFVTGTDTGVGKTVLTASLLYYLRSKEIGALAVKPFATGTRGDAERLAALQPGSLTLDQVNPFFFPQPVTPLLAARRRGRSVALGEVLAHINRFARQCQVLLVEGAGGLLSPLGENFTALDLIQKLKCEVIVVAANRLGMLNHSCLTRRALQDVDAKCLTFAVLDTTPNRLRRSDVSSSSNAHLLRELLAPAEVVELPYLGLDPARFTALKRNEKKLKKVLARILA